VASTVWESPQVRSEVLGHEQFAGYTVNMDVADGVVTLRGQLDRPEDIRELTKAVSKVAGVQEVRNYLHLPGTPPPNLP
jgi:osmotically-inducible protein OsmY